MNEVYAKHVGDRARSLDDRHLAAPERRPGRDRSHRAYLAAQREFAEV